MCLQKYLDNLQKIQSNIIEYLDSTENIEENYHNLIDVLFETKIQDNYYVFKSILYTLLNISNNYHRYDNFFCKIDQILIQFKDYLQKEFSNSEIFHVFKSNKRILLFLLEENIITMDKYIVKIITKGQYSFNLYPQYFSPEIKPFINEEWLIINHSKKHLFEKIKKELPEDFYEKRKIGENDNFICRLIQQDSIEEFITYVNRNSIQLNSMIPQSIYETNSLLLSKRRLNLIEYAAFYGSIKIFNYLRLNKVKLTPDLWIFAVHGQNPKIIHILEENHIEPSKKRNNKKIDFYTKILTESIKCHHFDTADYIKENYLKRKKDDLSKIVLVKSLKYYNFKFINNNDINESSFYYFCKYDYYYLAFIILKETNIDINIKTLDTLIKRGIDIYKEADKKHTQGKTALYAAVEKENIEIVKFLLTFDNIDVNIINEVYRDKIYHEFCCRDEVVKVRKEFLEEKTVLYTAVEKENIEIVKLLLSKDDININFLNQVREVGGESPNIEDLEKWEKTALFNAVKKENIEIVKLLLTNKKLNINIMNKEYFYDKEFEEYYDASDDDYLNPFQKTSLFEAVALENIELVKTLLTYDKLNINILNIDYGIIYLPGYGGGDRKITALHLAVEKNNITIIKVLLADKRINANIKDDYGVIPMNYTNSETIKELFGN